MESNDPVVTELRQMQTDLEELLVEKAKLQGKHDQVMENLKEKGFDTLEAAKTARNQEVIKLNLNISKAEDLVKSFKEKYGDHIE